MHFSIFPGALKRKGVRQVRPMYVQNDFSFKNVLGAAYNQVRFIVRNLR